MDARCYAGSKVRTKYKKATFGWGDALGLLFFAGLIVGVVLLNKFYLYPYLVAL
jgi:energy-coupling factor transporter transmembrane protein EcfT